MSDHQGDHAAHEIAERVHEVRGVPRIEARPTEIAITVEGNLTQEEIAKRVGPIPLDGIGQLDPDARRLAETRSIHRDEPVHPHTLRQRQPRGVKHSGPQYAVKPRDVLADDMHLRGPRDRTRPDIGESRRREVARQGVEPDVDHLMASASIGEWERNSPIQRRPRDRDVVEAAPDERHDLVAASLGLDELRARVQKRREELLECAEAEEPVRFGDALDLERRVHRAPAPREVVRRPK